MEFLLCTIIIHYPPVGNDAVKHASHCEEPDNQGTAFFVLFLAATMMIIEFDHIVRDGEP